MAPDDKLAEAAFDKYWKAGGSRGLRPAGGFITHEAFLAGRESLTDAEVLRRAAEIAQHYEDLNIEAPECIYLSDGNRWLADRLGGNQMTPDSNREEEMMNKDAEAAWGRPNGPHTALTDTDHDAYVVGYLARAEELLRLADTAVRGAKSFLSHSWPMEMMGEINAVERRLDAYMSARAEEPK